MSEIWPYDNTLLVETCRQAAAEMGYFSTAVALHEMLFEIDPILTAHARDQVGKSVPLFPDISLREDEAPGHFRQLVSQLVKELRSRVARYEVIVTANYESMLWDSVFENTPDKVFFVTVESRAATPSRLAYFFKNVQAVTIDDIPFCGGPQSLFVMLAYGDARPGGQSVYVPTFTRHIATSDILTAYSERYLLRLFPAQLTVEPVGMSRIDALD